ncbi:YicC/YloC family endoribonuclease [Thiomonas intermedia]|uniref:YicC/YloC family endoribonuclease n=1 Tax=Thiomonas intermedia TaxID=926 RepID=UPI0015CFD382|nr:YicC/YloC family endoribonuclease [Thiomonas intermedia]
MTGYGQNSAQLSTGAKIHIELRSVNSRFLDIAFRLPEELRGAEAAMRQSITQALRRGKVDCRAVFEAPQSAPALPDPGTAAPLLAAEAALRAMAPHLTPLSVGEVLRFIGGAQEGHADAAEIALIAGQALDQALAALIAARAQEGDRLRALLLDRIEQIAQHAVRARAIVPLAVERQQARFTARWEEALRALTGVETSAETLNDRRLQEAASFALRIDVAEELDRLQAHLQTLRELLAQGGELGKRLDFLIQELHREANTLGSKSAALELSEISLELKVLIEQMREQVQNIE